MHVNLKITTITEYLDFYGLEPCLNEMEESLLERIITVEVSIYLLRRSTGHGLGYSVDVMKKLRRNLITVFNTTSTIKYDESQDFE